MREVVVLDAVRTAVGRRNGPRGAEADVVHGKTKFEIRSTKSETNPNHQIPKPQTGPEPADPGPGLVSVILPGLGVGFVSDFVLRISNVRR